MNIYVYSVSCSKYNKKNNQIIINELMKTYNDLQLYSFDDFLNDNKILNMDIDHLIVSGGDGVLHRIVNHLKNKLDQITFGYIPMGTANDFAHNYHLDCKNIKESIDIIKSNNVINIPLINLNDNLVLYGISMGKMSNVSINTSKKSKKILHKFIYKLKGIKYMFSKKVDVLYKDLNSNEEKIYHVKALLIFKTKYLGGVRIAKKINEQITLVTIKNIFSLIKLFIFGRFMNIKNLKESEFELICDSVWCVDGELIDLKKAKISYNQNKIRLLSKNT